MQNPSPRIWKLPGPPLHRGSRERAIQQRPRTWRQHGWLGTAAEFLLGSMPMRIPGSTIASSIASASLWIARITPNYEHPCLKADGWTGIRLTPLRTRLHVMAARKATAPADET